MSIPHRLSAESAEATPTRTERADTTVESNAEPLTDADALAVRAIARFNVERRQAGAAPLDLKGIEHLRRILTDTIERYEASKRTSRDEAH
jgi:hypothetical protein